MKKSEKYLSYLLELISNETPANEQIYLYRNIRNIFELILQKRYSDLDAYLEDKCESSPNKNYNYRIREKLSREIQAGFEFINEIESNV